MKIIYQNYFQPKLSPSFPSEISILFHHVLYAQIEESFRIDGNKSPSVQLAPTVSSTHSALAGQFPHSYLLSNIIGVNSVSDNSKLSLSNIILYVNLFPGYNPTANDRDGWVRRVHLRTHHAAAGIPYSCRFTGGACQPLQDKHTCLLYYITLAACRSSHNRRIRKLVKDCSKLMRVD